MMPNPYDSVPLGQQTDPLSMPENNISYGDITRFQMISQYQQQMANYPRSSSQYARMMSQPRFQYGTNGQDTRFYQRQAEVSRNVYGSGLTKGVFDIGSFAATAPIFSALAPGAAMFSAAGLATGFALPMIATAAPLYFINKGIDRTLQRQRAMQSIASDVEQYRERIGMQNMTYSQATQIGSNLTNSMFSRGQYFDPQKQQEILKMGLANDMLSGRGRGMVTGDAKTFEKNFKELMDTVKQVTKTMKVTAEGAMSVVKEMQQGGFGTMGQISNAMTSAKAFGSMTGLGTQNMLQIGAAGAQAAQGTPYWSSSGANMYMGGAAMAGAMARGNDPRSQKAVEMVGGVAQAGGIIAQTQMNLMQSGMGARIIASMMNSKQKLDPTALNNFIQGRQSGHEVVTLASQRAHGFGTSRVLFERNRSEIANQIAQDPILASQYAGANFNTWRSSRRGTREEQAWAFAKTFVQGGQREQNLYAEFLLSGKAMSEMAAQSSVANAVANEKGPFPGFWSKVSKRSEETGPGNWLMNVGRNTAEGTGDVWGAAGAAISGTKRRARWAAGSAVEGITGINLNRRSLGNVEQGYKNLLGLNNVNLSNTAISELNGLNAAQRKAAGVMTATEGETLGWSSSLIAGQSNDDRSRFYQTIRTVLGGGSTGAILNNADALRALGMKKSDARYEKFRKASRTQQMQAILNMGTIMSNKDSAALELASKNLSSVNTFLETFTDPAKKEEMRVFLDRKGGMTKQELDKVNGTALQNTGINAMRTSMEAQATLSQISGIDRYVPGKIASYELIKKGNDEQALIKMGLSPGKNIKAGLGIGLGGLIAAPLTGGASLLPGMGAISVGYSLFSGLQRYRTKQGISRLAGGISVDTDASEALAKIAQRVSSGALDMDDESKMDPGVVNRIKDERKRIKRAFDLKGGTWNDLRNDMRDRFGVDAKTWSDNAQRAKAFQSIIGKNEAAIKLLKYQNVDGGLIQQTQQYLDVANKTGILSGDKSVMSIGVAQTIAANLLPGTKAEEIQKMAKSGELTQRLYYTSKTDVGQTSRIKYITDEVNRISNATKKEDFYYKDFGDETTKPGKLMSREVALELALKKLDLEQRVQKLNETTESAQGKSMNSVIAPPILNYWNNKWSL